MTEPKPQPAGVDRRTFMRRGAMGAGAMWAMSLTELVARRRAELPAAAESPYGPVSPKIDESTGLALLQLPDGFRYFSYGWTGDRMSDGVTTPAAHDGMAVVDFLNGNKQSPLTVLVRNHEVDAGAPYLNRPGITYRSDGGGGTTNLVFDCNRGKFMKAWSSLAGTIRNCAGGVTPWGSWITCEETGAAGHGWCFDVGPQAGDPTPLMAMGRFSHEAMMVDPATGYVYETEDNGTSSGFYKFVPHVFGQLKEGGELFMMKVKNVTRANLTGGFPIGTTWEIEWVPIADPTAATRSCFNQGRDLGAANFRRLEGAWWGHNKGYFLATEGGITTQGQVFEYNPDAAGERITLIYDSPNANELDNPDNMTVTPRGGLLLCEDNATSPSFAPGERLVGVTLDGNAFTFAINNIDFRGLASTPNNLPKVDNRQNEWAGACYSPDGKWLFVNIQTPGVTFAITGPWGPGPL